MELFTCALFSKVWIFLVLKTSFIIVKMKSILVKLFLTCFFFEAESLKFCPKTHPNALENGRYCCENSDSICNSGGLRYTSRFYCCTKQYRIKCPSDEPCENCK